MTEFKRTTQAVDDIEALVQAVLDGTGDVQRLSQMTGEAIPAVEKLRSKAAETDPTKQTYGPNMRAKVQALVERWRPLEQLARDVLQQNGVAVAAPEPGLAPPPPAPARERVAFSRPAPIGGASSVTTGPNPSAARPAPVTAPSSSSVLVGSGSTPLGGATGGAASMSAAARREAAARAAEARNSGGSAAAGGASGSAAASSSQPLQSMEVDQQTAQAPIVHLMEELLHLVHCVFLGHGLTRGADVGAGAGPIRRVRYVRADENGQMDAIVATYVPVQRHLVVYAVLEAAGGAGAATTRCNVELGMTTASVQAKVDYLLVYPLIYRNCVPVLDGLPPEVSFSILSSSALPALAALGTASKGFAKAALEDDVLWWRIALNLPQTDALTHAMSQVREAQQRGEALPAGTCRRLVREEVQRQRDEAERRRRQREEAMLLERQMRESMRQPMRNPFPGGGPGGFGILGGDHDLFPGGGFGGNPFGGGLGGGRRPFGGGGGFGGGFGGGGIM